MGLIELFVVVLVFGLIFWAISAYLPVPQPFKNILLVILVLMLCLWLLHAVGVIGSGVFLHVH